MAEQGDVRASKILKKYNIGLQTLVDFLNEKGFEIEQTPNSWVPANAIPLIESAFKSEHDIKEQSKKVATKIKEITDKVKKDSQNDNDEGEEETLMVRTSIIENKNSSAAPAANDEKTKTSPAEEKPEPETEPENKPAAQPARTGTSGFKIIGKIELDKNNNVIKPSQTETPTPKPAAPAESTIQEETKQENEPKPESNEPEEQPMPANNNITGIKSEIDRLPGPKIIGKIDLPVNDKKGDKKSKNKSKRERIHKTTTGTARRLT